MAPLLGSHWWPLWGLPLCTAFGLFLVWLWRGRDDHAALPFRNTWQPPRELSPAQVATLIDNSCDQRDIVATLVDLAARGYLSIEEAVPGDLVLTSGDLRFVRSDNSPPVERLKCHERMFLKALFDPQPPDIERGRRPANTALSDEPWNETALSLLHNKFYRNLPEIEGEIYGSLMAEGFFFSDPKAARTFFATVGIWVIGGGFYLLRFGLFQSSDWLSLPLGMALAGLVWSLSSPFMPAKTALGTAKAEEIHRFIYWVDAVPIPTLCAMIRKDNRLFERLLPYALVLGIGPLWAQKCDECGQWAPEWFCYNSVEEHTAPRAVARLMGYLPSVEKVFASAPPVRHHSTDARHGGMDLF